MTFNEIVGIDLAPLYSRELVFPHNALMAVELALYAILENTGSFGQQTNDLKASSDLNPLVPIGREANRLSDGKLVCRHVLLSWGTRGVGRLMREDSIGAAAGGRLACCIDACGDRLLFERNLPLMPLHSSGRGPTGQLIAQRL